MIIIATIFLPLLSSIICGLLNCKLSHKQAGIISSLALILSAIGASIIFIDVGLHGNILHIKLLEWINSGGLTANWAIYIDKISSIMLVVVTFVSALVHIYSLGYMEHDPNLPRFMSYLSLFTFFMLLLVTSDNFIQLFCGWEGVGFCSYLLIGFWYKKTSACDASIKAFIVNRISDFAFILAICLVFVSTGSIEFIKVFSSINEIINTNISFAGNNLPLIEVICILILVGCMGKSAQIGLHIWLPDAMEGPTPVSALIHAATMVTAGVFMIARCSHLFEFAEYSLYILTIVGSVTCLFAATIALTQNDIKKIIAYSTCSQLGYMFFACGVSTYNAAIFHLFTHAFFKALLFLGAGSVIHAVSGEQDIRKMGALWKKIPITYSLFWVGSLAIAGIFPLAGYFSKDLILEAAYASNSQVGYIAYWFGIIAAFCTAFYSWRLLILVFHGTSNVEKGALSHIHESPLTMMIPMLILSVGAILSGIYGVYALNIDEVPGYFMSSIYINDTHNNLENIHHLEWHVKAMPTIAGIFGILSAYALYNKQELVLRLSQWFKPLYLLSYNKYYIDEIYNKTVVSLFFIKAELAKIIDNKVIDRFGPDGAAYVFKKAAGYMSRLQTGLIFSYASFILLGLIMPITWLVKIYLIT
jgi:NADH-quinone oxidoreductase subunit L